MDTRLPLHDAPQNHNRLTPPLPNDVDTPWTSSQTWWCQTFPTRGHQFQLCANHVPWPLTNRQDTIKKYPIITQWNSIIHTCTIISQTHFSLSGPNTSNISDLTCPTISICSSHIKKSIFCPRILQEGWSRLLHLQPPWRVTAGIAPPSDRLTWRTRAIGPKGGWAKWADGCREDRSALGDMCREDSQRCGDIHWDIIWDIYIYISLIEGSLEVKLPTIWTVEKQRWEESEEKRSEERRCRCAKR